MIKITFPDGNVKEFEAGVTTFEIAKSISPSLAKKTLAGKVNGKLIDATRAINEDSNFEIVTPDHEDALGILRHSAAHLFAQAAKRHFPDIHLGVGPAIQDGFYYDTDNEAGQISNDDLATIEAEMKKIVKENFKSERKEVSKEEAKEIFANDPYKLELIEEHNEDEGGLTIYTQGEYTDLCRGPHVPSTGVIKFFHLLNVAGAYWLPAGATIRRIIERFVVDQEVKNGYQHVITPVMMNLNTYKQSGHWQHYHEDMYPPMDMGDGEEMELRPMNCPSHIAIYKHHVHSYRELPIRIAEFGMMHRYEKSGALSGLQRVREMTLNDGHTFVMLEQVQEEFSKILQLIMDMYRDFGINDYSFRLSYRDPKDTVKYFPDDEMWEKSQAMLKATMDDMNLDYVEAEGEAAFYGPKLDIQVKTALGNEETLSTIQLDFLNPENFDISYIGADGEKHRPVMIHRGVISTLERFIAYLIEVYKGAFPTWLAPTQATIIPVNNEIHADYAWKIQRELQDKGFRVVVDEANEKMGWKIRQSQTHKIPYQIVIGDQEQADGTVNIRRYGSKETKVIPLEEFIENISADVANFSRVD